MLRGFIAAADSATPEYIIGKRKLFPTLCRMIEAGVSAEFSAYVQKGYQGSYSSEQNWASIYTGLAPWEHGITTNFSNEEARRPEMRDFDKLSPFWKMLNDSGLSVGLWAADNCASPVPIKKGYVVSCTYGMIATPTENREAPRTLQLSDEWLEKYFECAPTSRLYPRTLAQRGYSFEAVKNDSELAEKVVCEYQLEDVLANFEAELAYWFDAMRHVQRENPVDVLYFFTPTTDLIAHCCLCCDDNAVLIKAYQILDQYIGAFIDEFCPEVTIFLSDHGQQNFKELVKCRDPQTQREAFAARDDVLWLRNGYIAFEAHNGALLFTAHSLKGTFVASGKGIRHTSVSEMRTLDIYPTFLEIFGVKIPKGRSGYVADIFDRSLLNSDQLLNAEKQERKTIALLQKTHAMNVMDIVLNELYIENRFARITVVGEEKYREIFLNNPRVSCFLAVESFDIKMFDETYVAFYNEDTRVMRHIKL